MSAQAGIIPQLTGICSNTQYVVFLYFFIIIIFLLPQGESRVLFYQYLPLFFYVCVL